MRKETKVTEKRKKLIHTKKYMVKVVARPEPIPKTSNTTVQPPLTTPSAPPNSEKNKILHKKVLQVAIPTAQKYPNLCWHPMARSRKNVRKFV